MNKMLICGCLALVGLSGMAYSAPLPKVNCTELSFKQSDGSEDPYSSGTSCLYAGKSLAESYQSYREESLSEDYGKSLRKNIPSMVNYNDTITDGQLWISYKWNSPDNLEVELAFAGGVTKVEFKQSQSGTEIRTIASAD